MTNLPDPVETNLMDMFVHSTNSGNWVAPTSIYVGLCTDTPTDTNFYECNGTNYARVQIQFGVASGGQATGPTTTANFTSAGGSWGTIKGYIICSVGSTVTTGNAVLAYGAVSPTVAVTTNDTVSFAANAISLTFS